MKERKELQNLIHLIRLRANGNAAVGPVEFESELQELGCCRQNNKLSKPQQRVQAGSWDHIQSGSNSIVAPLLERQTVHKLFSFLHPHHGLEKGIVWHFYPWFFPCLLNYRVSQEIKSVTELKKRDTKLALSFWSILLLEQHRFPNSLQHLILV